MEFQKDVLIFSVPLKNEIIYFICIFECRFPIALLFKVIFIIHVHFLSWLTTFNLDGWQTDPFIGYYMYIKGNQVEIMPWNWVFYSAADSPSRHFLRSSCHPHTCSVELFPPFISSLASSILNLCLSWKSFQLQRPTSSKPHRLLPAKSYIQVHAESPTEINGKRAAASPGGPHLLLLPLVLLTCFLTIWRVVVTASEQSTHSVAMTFLLACFTWRLNFLVLGPQINFSSVDVCNTHKWVGWKQWNKISESANEAGIGSRGNNEGQWNLIQGEESLSVSTKRHSINLNDDKY